MTKPETPLRRWRKRRGLTQSQLADRVGTRQQQIAKLENAQRRLSDDWLGRLAQALDIAPSDLLPGSIPSIPVRYLVSSAFAESRPDQFVVRDDNDRVHPPRGLDEPENCAAARILDDSADILYAPGSEVIYRPIVQIAVPLEIGTEILVRHYAATRRTAMPMEVLVGYLDANFAGDLVLVTRSSNRQVPASIVIQPFRGTAGLTDRSGEWRAAQLGSRPTITYTANADDPGDIVGVIVAAMVVK